MAIVQNNPDDEELLRQQQAAGGAVPITGTTGVGSGSAGATSGAGPTAGSFQSPQSAGLSGFTDVGAYLDANKDQSLDLANKVAGSLGNQAAQTKSDIDAYGTQFKQNVDASTVNPNADLVNQAAADPTGFASNPDNVAQFTKQRTAQYTGPTQFEAGNDYSKLTGDLAKDDTSAANVNTEQGRQSLLYGLGANPTAGQVSLDQLLLGANPQSESIIASAAKPFAGLHDYLSGAGATGNQYAAGAKAGTGQASQLVADKFTGAGGVVPSFQADLSKRLGDATQQRTAYNAEYSDINNRLNQAPQPGQPFGLTPNEYNDLKLNPQNLDQIGNAMQILSSNYQQPAALPSSFWEGASQNFQTPTAQNVSTSDDYAKAQALQQLMGSPVGGFDASHPEAAGMYDPSKANLGSFNLDKANAATIGQVNQLDKSSADSFIQKNYPYLLDPTLNDPSMAYVNMLHLVQTDPALQTGGLLGGANLLSALSRLTKGFTPPSANWTPVINQPSLAGPGPVPQTSQGGHAAR